MARDPAARISPTRAGPDMVDRVVAMVSNTDRRRGMSPLSSAENTVAVAAMLLHWVIKQVAAVRYV